MADKKYKIVIEITETYEWRDEEEKVEYRKAIRRAMKMAQNHARRALNQVLGKSVSVSVKTEALKGHNGTPKTSKESISGPTGCA